MIRLLMSLALAFVATRASAQSVQPIEVEWPETAAHMIGDRPVIVVPWRDASTLQQQVYGGDWSADVVVDGSGRVTDARLEYGPTSGADAALAAAEQVRFEPFLRDGVAVPVRLSIHVYGRTADYVGPEHRSFPADIDLSDVVIRLQRTGCFGTCPSYSVTVRGDGFVTYSGDGFVLAPGHFSLTIPEAAVRALLEVFRRANYYELDGYYTVDASDLPSYITRLDLGEQRKFVYNYGGSGMGEAVASTGSFAGSGMPLVVTEVEEAIDRLSSALALVSGNDHSAQLLAANGFDFRGPAGSNALGYLVTNCSLALAREFIAVGASARGRYVAFGAEDRGTPIVLLSPRCGDLEFVRQMARAGALRNRSIADEFLFNAAASGFPAIVAEALQYSDAVNRRVWEGQTPLMEAAQAFEPDADDPRFADFSRTSTVALLLARGANPRLKDEHGDTALHFADDAEVVALLIAAGADPNARNEEEETPLFNAYGGEVVQALVRGGADPNVVADGLSALETARTAEAARALLDAGAIMPTDASRMSEWLRLIQFFRWEVIPQRIVDHARALGVEIPSNVQ